MLFMPYRAGQIAALRSTISAWMRLAIFEAMNREEGEQRLWFVVDELDALGQIDGLKDALARLRKFGGRCVLGFQSIAQVSSTYGSGRGADARGELRQHAHPALLRQRARRHLAVRLAPDRRARGDAHHDSRDRGAPGRVAADDHAMPSTCVVEPAVMASEIEQLPDLCRLPEARLRSAVAARVTAGTTSRASGARAMPARARSREHPAPPSRRRRVTDRTQSRSILKSRPGARACGLE